MVAALFPENAEKDNRFREDPAVVRLKANWFEDYSVTAVDLNKAVKRMTNKNTALDADDFPERVWAIALISVRNCLKALFDKCLQLERFSTSWKKAALILIPKKDRPLDNPSAHQRVCLISEMGKLFKRVITSPLVVRLA